MLPSRSTAERSDLPGGCEPVVPTAGVRRRWSVRGRFPACQARHLGSVEDHELLLRVLRSGRTVVYDPRITVHAEVQPNRLERAYHRRWHSGHGHFHALLRSEQMEQRAWERCSAFRRTCIGRRSETWSGGSEPRRSVSRSWRSTTSCASASFAGSSRRARREFAREATSRRRAELWRLLRSAGPPTRAADADGRPPRCGGTE